MPSTSTTLLEENHVSIGANPNNLNVVTARRISLDVEGDGIFDDGVNVVLGWVSAPIERGPLGPEATPKLQSLIEDDPYYTDWSLLDTVHIGDCEISPNHTYLIQNILQGDDENDRANYSDALALRTVFQWGDVVDYSVHPPQNVVNLDDVNAIVAGFQGTQVVTKVWLDLEPDVPDFSRIDLADAFHSVLAFEGEAYPFSDPLMCNGQGAVSSPKSGPLPLIGTQFFLVPQPVQMSDAPTVDVDVFITAVNDLTTYELALDVTQGVVELESVFVDETRSDFVFHGQECIVGVDPEHVRLGAVRWEHSVDLTSPGYLGTFRFKFQPSQAGDVMTGLQGGEATYLLNSGIDTIPAATDNVTDLLPGLIQQD